MIRHRELGTSGNAKIRVIHPAFKEMEIYLKEGERKVRDKHKK